MDDFFIKRFINNGPNRLLIVLLK